MTKIYSLTKIVVNRETLEQETFSKYRFFSSITSAELAIKMLYENYMIIDSSDNYLHVVVQSCEEVINLFVNQEDVEL